MPGGTFINGRREEPGPTPLQSASGWPTPRGFCVIYSPKRAVPIPDLGNRELFRVKYLWTTLVISMLDLVSSAMGLFMAGTYARDTASWTQQAGAPRRSGLREALCAPNPGYLAREGPVRGFQA